MRPYRMLVAAAAMAALMAAAAGCQEQQLAVRSEAPAAMREAPAPAAVATVNRICPMSQKPVNSSSPTRLFEGRTIGFWCSSCPEMWDALTVEQKRAKLSAALEQERVLPPARAAR